MSNVNFLVVQQHAIDGLDGRLCSLGGVIVDETITLGASALVCCNLARENVAEGGESVMKSLEYHRVRPNKRRGKRASGFITLLSICSSRFLMKILP